MMRLQKYFIWYYMLSKRLLQKWSFVVLLCIIPVIIPLTNSVMSEDSGVLRVVLCNEGKNEAATEVIDSLMNYDGVILFSHNDSEKQATNAVAQSEADAAWVFSSDFDSEIDAYDPNGEVKPIVNIIQREESIPLQLSREVLYGAMYKKLSYSIYKNFIYSEVVSEDVLSETEAERYYSSKQKPGSIIEVQRLNSDGAVSEVNYLTAPLRGILSVLIMLCTLASAMYFLKDQANGKFNWMSHQKRLAPAFASCLAAACLSAFAVFTALQFSNISVGFFHELTAMLVYIACVTGFCLVISVLLRSSGKLGAMIPGIIIVTIALSPIFFNMKVLRPVRLMLPTYYYLQSVYNGKYYLYALFYCIAVYSLAFIINELMSKREQKKSLI